MFQLDVRGKIEALTVQSLNEKTSERAKFRERLSEKVKKKQMCVKDKTVRGKLIHLVYQHLLWHPFTAIPSSQRRDYDV